MPKFLSVVFFAGMMAITGLAGQAQASITVTDDLGNQVTLAKPAQRVISLSPHVTELIYAVGAGERIIGTVKYSDYPAQAKNIPRVGDNRQLDLERVLAMKPDLLIVWMHGAYERQLETLRQSGIPYFFSEPHKLDNIAETFIKLGSLFGTEKQAQLVATEFRQQIQQLSSQYQNKSKVKTFYQVWGKPLYTLNDSHIVSDAIHLCGGENIFGKLPVTAPVVSTEAVLQENPEAIITGDSKTQAVSGIEQWKTFPSLLATKNSNLISIEGDLVNRSGPRIIEGTKLICQALEQARQKREVKK
jgi:iron complex transport system substrate-binding protein